MQNKNHTSIPLTIITGFLGSGKTSLLNHILHADHGLRVAVLVNDFGAINIDSQLVRGIEGETVSLSNGCICCSIRGDLIKAVSDLLHREEAPDYIIVETSGVSDPLEVALTFQSIQGLSIDSIITLIDAEQILSLDPRYAVLAMNQVGMADIVILNKVDLVDSKQLQAARAYIKGIVAQARIIETVQANLPLELLLNVGTFNLDRLLQRPMEAVHVHVEGDEHSSETHQHTDHSLVFSTWSWQSPEPISYSALKQMVTKLPETIYRAKGIFYLAEEADRKGILQVVGRRVSLSLSDSWSTETPHSQMVVIGAASELDAEGLRRCLEACLAANASQSGLERIGSSVVEWLRQHLPGR